MRVRFTAVAEHDLETIANFIAEDNPERAASFVQELIDHCSGLSHHPRRHAVFVVRDGREIRRNAYKRYLIFYSVLDGVVEINHVVHSARDYVRLLFPED